jgi:hypothetical protein
MAQEIKLQVKKKPGLLFTPAIIGFGELKNFIRLELFDLSRLWPFVADLFHKADALALTQGLKPGAFDSAEMDKNILSTVSLDKAITFAVVKPFHFTFRHFLAPSLLLFFCLFGAVLGANLKPHLSTAKDRFLI